MSYRAGLLRVRLRRAYELLGRFAKSSTQLSLAKLRFAKKFGSGLSVLCTAIRIEVTLNGFLNVLHTTISGDFVLNLSFGTF
jgi:hypothetical protein